MADDTKQLLIKVSATTELLRSQMIAAENSVANFERNTNARLGKVDSAFARLGKGAGLLQAAFAGGVAGAVAGVVNQLGQLPGALIAATKAGLDFAGSIGEAAQKVGVGTQFLQEFRYAVEQNGGTVESADNALSKFSISLGKAFRGSKEAGEAFAALGLNLKDLAAASDSQRFQLVADAIKAIHGPASQSAAAVAIFGKGAKDIIPTLIAGADAFRKQAAEARAYGLVLSDTQIQNADKTADKIQALQRALGARIAGAVADNAEAIGALTNALVNLGIQAVNAAARYARFRSIASLGAGGGTGDQAAAAITSTKDGRQQLFSSINAAIRAGGSRLPGDELGAVRFTNAADRARNLVNLNRQRDALIRIARSSRTIEAARPALSTGGFALDEDAVSSGGGGKKKGGGASRIRKIKVDAEDATVAALRLKFALQDVLDKLDPGELTKREATGSFVDFDKISGELDEFSRGLTERLVEPALDASRRTSDAFRTMTDSVANSIRDLASAVDDGDFLGILQTAVNLFSSLAGTGLFGAKLQTKVSGARAAGGPVGAGQTYLVGERGPELFTPRLSGHIISNDNLSGGGGLRVQVVKGDLFDVIVDSRAQRVAAPMAAQAAVQGSQGAQTAIMRRSTRRLA